MDDVCILGVNKDYVPTSSSFSIDTFNITFEVDKYIEYLSKISCCINGYIEEIFKSLGTNYAAIYLNIEIRVDYMCDNDNMNFYKFSINKIIYINLGSGINSRMLNIDTDIIDLGVINIDSKSIDMYILTAVGLS